jgi:hypothetical protein
MDPDEFDAGPSGDDPSLTALAACDRCPVKAECLADAMRTEVNGYRAEVRAGLTPVQRNELARRRRA